MNSALSPQLRLKPEIFLDLLGMYSAKFSMHCDLVSLPQSTQISGHPLGTPLPLQQVVRHDSVPWFLDASLLLLYDNWRFLDNKNLDAQVPQYDH